MKKGDLVLINDAHEDLAKVRDSNERDIQVGDLVFNGFVSFLGIVIHVNYFPRYRAFTILTMNNSVIVYNDGSFSNNPYTLRKVMHASCL